MFLPRNLVRKMVKIDGFTNYKMVKTVIGGGVKYA